MDKKVFVSEAEIAYWGCVFPSIDARPKRVYVEKFLGKDVKIYFYDFPSSEDFLHFRSIEQNLAFGMHEPITAGKHGRPARLGFRIATYCSFNKSEGEVLRYAHSALQFARCFKNPPKRRDPDGVSEHLMKIHTMHAERLQHMSGMRNMTSKDLKGRLCDRRTYGVTFGHFVIHAYRKGIIQMPVEALRLWLAGAFDVQAVREFMRNEEYEFQMNLCIFCHVTVARPALCTVKLGSRWAQVEVRVAAAGTHSRELDLKDIDSEVISIVFEVDHI